MTATVIRLYTSPWRALRRWMTERSLFVQIRAAEFEIKNTEADIAKWTAELEAKRDHLEELVNAVQRNRLS